MFDIKDQIDKHKMIGKGVQFLKKQQKEFEKFETAWWKSQVVEEDTPIIHLKPIKKKETKQKVLFQKENFNPMQELNLDCLIKQTSFKDDESIWNWFSDPFAILDDLTS